MTPETVKNSRKNRLKKMRIQQNYLVQLKAEVFRIISHQHTDADMLIAATKAAG
jgi:hypothetical protein